MCPECSCWLSRGCTPTRTGLGQFWTGGLEDQNSCTPASLAVLAWSAAGGFPPVVLPEGLDKGTALWTARLFGQDRIQQQPAMHSFTQFGPLWPLIGPVAFHWALQQQRMQKDLGQTQCGTEWLPHLLAAQIGVRPGPGKLCTGNHLLSGASSSRPLPAPQATKKTLI